MLRAATAMHAAASSSILHLRTVNPYVASALTTSGRQSYSLPRTATAAISRTSDGASATGISAFAYQGTIYVLISNSHTTRESHLKKIDD